MRQSKLHFFAIILLCLASAGQAAGPAATERDPVEDWFEQDQRQDQYLRTINEGDLKFLPQPPKEAVHHHHNTIILTAESLQSGWAKMLQCHDNLDTFPSAQIVYNAKRIRDLKITASENIEQAWIEGASVQLKHVQPNARLCVEAVSRVLRHNADGSFSVHNGPFMRRFLDGYFPMHVSMEVKFPATLEFVEILPQQQEGFRVVKNSDGISLDAWFEGKLRTEIRLRSKASN